MKKPRLQKIQILKKQKTLKFVGLDEVGRGSWAGPVVSGAVILKSPFRFFSGLTDSKKLNVLSREVLFYKILDQALDFGIGVSSSQEVDQLGLKKATLLSFERALQSLSSSFDHILIDGKDHFSFSYPSTEVIKGDESIAVISAASVVAKVYRDALMRGMCEDFPHYFFEEHKGYGTLKHRQVLESYGPSRIHRLSYKPVHYFSCKQLVS